MANGTTKIELARADRIREKARQRQRGFGNALQRDKLQSISGDDEISEVTANLKGVHARAPIPREGRIALAIALSVLILALAIRLVWVR